MTLFDTNIFIDFYKANPEIIATLRHIGIQQLALSVITKAELFYGARDKQELGKIKQHLALCHCYSLDEASSVVFLDLMNRYCLSHRASIPDMLIAATAITHQLQL